MCNLKGAALVKKTSLASCNCKVFNGFDIFKLSFELLVWFCPGVRVHKGISIVLSLFRSHWVAVVHCLVLCSCSCEPVHEDRTPRLACHIETFSCL